MESLHQGQRRRKLPNGFVSALSGSPPLLLIAHRAMGARSGMLNGWLWLQLPWLQRPSPQKRWREPPQGNLLRTPAAAGGIRALLYGEVAMICCALQTNVSIDTSR